MELHPLEAMLIQRLRTRYSFGNITVVVKDGLPVDILNAIARDHLLTEWKDGTMKE